MDLHQKKREALEFFDFWNGFFAIIIGSLMLGAVLGTILFPNDILTAVLVVITGIYAFATIIQMREARRQGQYSPLQPDVEYVEEVDNDLPGLKNFGDESIHGFECIAVLESGDKCTQDITRKITKWEEPTSIPPGEFEPVVANREKFKNELRETAKFDDGQLSLYYAYSTPSSGRTPADAEEQEELLNRGVEELQKDYSVPKKFDANSLYERCFPEK